MQTVTKTPFASNNETAHRLSTGLATQGNGLAAPDLEAASA
jgi:hypothetical protein